ncbi:MAG: DUF1493 family protein [Mangrovibacterium sp.]|jgi:hypothetical protein
MLDNRLINLIEEYSPLKEDLKSETSLYHDLNIYGDDADELLTKYSKIFGVSIKNLSFTEYFPSEGDSVLPTILRIIRGKKREKYKKLTLQQLQDSIETKELK